MELRDVTGSNILPVYKIAVVGDRLCGKTSLINRFINDDMNAGKDVIGMEFRYKHVIVDGREVKLQIFDHKSDRWKRPGQVGRASLDVSANFLRKAAGLLICFSLTDRNAVNSVMSWREGCNDMVGKEIPCVLVGTKCDLDSFPEDNYKYFESMGCFKQCYETSARMGSGVTEAFEGLVRVIVDYEEEAQERSKSQMMSSCINLEQLSPQYLDSFTNAKRKNSYSKICRC